MAVLGRGLVWFNVGSKFVLHCNFAIDRTIEDVSVGTNGILASFLSFYLSMVLGDCERIELVIFLRI